MPSLKFAALAAAALLAGPVFADALTDRPDAAFGHHISEDDLALWNIAIHTPTGGNLPPGQGSVAEGAEVYERACMHCHGPEARGGEGYQFGTMVGGIGSMDQDPRVLTPGSMYPYAPIIFDYVRRAMPLDNPQSLSADEVYAVAAYIYNLNELVPDDFVANAETLPAIEMPNRGNFFTASIGDTHNTRCMSDCDPIGTVADGYAARAEN